MQRKNFDNPNASIILELVPAEIIVADAVLVPAGDGRVADRTGADIRQVDDLDGIAERVLEIGMAPDE